MTAPSVQRRSIRDWWGDAPTAWKVGLVAGIVAWFIAITESSVHTVNGAVTACSYLDYAKIGLGGLTVVLGVAGFVANHRSRRALPLPIAVVITLALVVDGVLLVLKGLDVVAGVCPV